MKLNIEIPSKMLLNCLKILVIIIVLLWCIVSSYLIYDIYGSINSIDNQLKQAKPNLSYISEYRPDSEKTEAYKLMFENIKYSNDKILDTIYWSLGGIMVAIFALLGTNFYFNKNKFDNLSQKNKNDIDSFSQQTKKELQEKITEKIDAYKKEIRYESLKVNEINQQQIKIFSDGFNSQLINIETKYKESTDKLKKSIEDNAQTASKSNDNIKNLIEKKYNLTKIEILKLESDSWFIKKVYANALTSLIKKMTLEIEAQKSISTSISDMVKVLENMNTISTYDKKSLNDLIQIIPKENDLLIEDIKKRLDAITVK